MLPWKHAVRWTLAAAAAGTTLSLGALAASAHVTVWPQQSTVNAYELYTMRVPTEKTVPTTKIVLEIPSGATFEDYQPTPGWTVSEHKDASGRIDRVTWAATGGGIAPGQFMQFAFIAKNPGSPTDLAWNAFQYYADGSIVTWTGDPNSDTPHSITHVLAAQPLSNATGAPANATTAQVSATPAAGAGERHWALGISVVSLVVSVVALVLGLRRR
ncbi:MAG: DUF1775 domain-containing protein [Thermoflavifilum sp.]|nr:DUF1775 domain-containing protein [Thermoflavifilum sp.]MCL6513028.1 DUF1775 domain-containing protein [Alicyclobacillus sp.]